MTELLLEYLDDSQEEGEERGLHREESFRIWALCQAFDWKHLPFPGTVLDQPDWFIEDVLTLSHRRKLLEDAHPVEADDGAPVRRLGSER